LTTAAATGALQLHHLGEHEPRLTVYNRTKYLDEMRDAIEKWDAKIAASIA
jgi:hypothetical protein